MDKQIVVYTYNRILFHSKKKWSTDACYSMNEPRKYSDIKEPDRKCHVFDDYFYMKYPE